MKTFGSLTVKELKHLLEVQAAKLDHSRRVALLRKCTGCEKSQLVKEVKRLVMEDEIDQVLDLPAPEPCDLKEEERVKPVRGQSARARMQEKQLDALEPSQLKQRAKLMRENPKAVRRSAPEYKDKTDEEIRKIADQLEEYANDPEKFKQMKEGMNAMQNMSPKDQQAFQRASQTMQNANLPEGGDEFDKLVHLKRADPEAFKALIKSNFKGKIGMSDETIDSLCDRLSADQIGMIFRSLKWLGNAYKVVDEKTFGCGKYILGIVVVIIIYLLAILIWKLVTFTWWLISYVLGRTPSHSSSNNPVNTQFTDQGMKSGASYNEDEEF